MTPLEKRMKAKEAVRVREEAAPRRAVDNIIRKALSMFSTGERSYDIEEAGVAIRHSEEIERRLHEALGGNYFRLSHNHPHHFAYATIYFYDTEQYGD